MIQRNVVLIHTDFRIYWPARIQYFFNSLNKSNYKLNVIELSGHGGNYNFDKRIQLPEYWECLFGSSPISELCPSEIKYRLFDRLNELKPDILIAGSIAFPSGAIALSYSVKHKIPLIIFDDSRIEDVPRNFFVNWVKSQLYSCVDAIFCPAPAWISTYKFFGFKEEQLFYGVDVVDNCFFQKTSNNDFIPDKLGQGYLLNIGRQIEKKNLLSLLKSYKRLFDKMDNLPKLVFVGDGDCHKELVSFVQEMKLEEKIVFIPFLSQGQLKSIYRNASVFILPSSYGETWGLVINEAMASGLPVIVSNKVGCASTLVNDGENGFVFDIYDDFGLEKKMRQFLEMTEAEKQRMSELSVKIISDWGLEKFSCGLQNAIKFVENKNRKKYPFFGKFISKFWKGRYNSV